MKTALLERSMHWCKYLQYMDIGHFHVDAPYLEISPFNCYSYSNMKAY